MDPTAASSYAQQYVLAGVHPKPRMTAAAAISVARHLDTTWCVGALSKCALLHQLPVQALPEIHACAHSHPRSLGCVYESKSWAGAHAVVQDMWNAGTAATIKHLINLTALLKVNTHFVPHAAAYVHRVIRQAARGQCDACHALELARLVPASTLDVSDLVHLLKVPGAVVGVVPLLLQRQACELLPHIDVLCAYAWYHRDFQNLQRRLLAAQLNMKFPVELAWHIITFY